ncbi:hypothetical protein [Haloplanus halophilus]|uniref:hypothetical protein n=1 Tax=Haloplanus halophilus TaxID=2949993 RepID=UPI00203FA750|nr:hypothetical protein [Haloplanus sp. GDY1]
MTVVGVSMPETPVDRSDAFADEHGDRPERGGPRRRHALGVDDSAMPVDEFGPLAPPE